MNHAAWNGLTATDLVFPTFVFVMGMSVVFAIEARLARGATRGQLVRHTVQRAVILCLLGIVVNSFPFFELDHMRFYGVLQRIAVCYLAVSLLYLWDRRAWPMAAALVVALVGYWVLLRWVPVPGAGMPGRDVPFMDVQPEPGVVDRSPAVPPSPVPRRAGPQRARSGRPAERPPGHRHGADGHADRRLAADAPIDSCEDAGAGRARPSAAWRWAICGRSGFR